MAPTVVAAGLPPTRDLIVIVITGQEIGAAQVTHGCGLAGLPDLVGIASGDLCPVSVECGWCAAVALHADQFMAARFGGRLGLGALLPRSLLITAR